MSIEYHMSLKLVSLFTLLTQVVFKQIDHPGHWVTGILHLVHLLRQSVSGSRLELRPVAPTG
jgi:hypothetical protein